MNTSLFDLSNRLASIEDLLENGLPETPEAEAELERILADELATREAVEQKAEAYCGYITELEALAFVRKTEAERLAKLAKGAAAQADRLRKGLREALARLNLRKLTTGRYQIGLRKPGGKAPLEIDEFLVPSEFTVTTTVTSVDKEAIRARLEAGENLEFARFADRQDYLTIK